MQFCFTHFAEEFSHITQWKIFHQMYLVLINRLDRETCFLFTKITQYCRNSSIFFQFVFSYICCFLCNIKCCFLPSELSAFSVLYWLVKKEKKRKSLFLFSCLKVVREGNLASTFSSSLPRHIQWQSQKHQICKHRQKSVQRKVSIYFFQVLLRKFCLYFVILCCNIKPIHT